MLKQIINLRLSLAKIVYYHKNHDFTFIIVNCLQIFVVKLIRSLNDLLVYDRVQRNQQTKL